MVGTLTLRGVQFCSELKKVARLTACAENPFLHLQCLGMDQWCDAKDFKHACLPKGRKVPTLGASPICQQDTLRLFA
jgi:hypothetical protein